MASPEQRGGWRQKTGERVMGADGAVAFMSLFAHF